MTSLAEQLNHHELRHMPVPSNPRGPPRKPQRSGFALWIGNLPPFTKIGELKDQFSVGATDDIESVFLMEKSNCAFANYRTEAACVAAMNRFRKSFHLWTARPVQPGAHQVSLEVRLLLTFLVQMQTIPVSVDDA